MDLPLARIRVNDLTREIIGAGITVHRELGPGLLESAYQQCMRQELTQRRIRFDAKCRYR